MYTRAMDYESSDRSTREAREHFADVINDAIRGRVTYITSNGRRVAAIVPLAVAEALASPNFPLDFPCRHSRDATPVSPSYPQRYRADRKCPQCGHVVPVQVVVQSPGVIGYRCGRGHMGLATVAVESARERIRP